jgi:tripartite-type tricarboxylate transporter receptor subunit TctC
MKKYVLSLIAAVTAFTCVTVQAQSQPWKPTKSIEIVVGSPPGGSQDNLGRLVSKIFEKHGWESHVTNRPGADGTIAANYVASQKPDGHTVFIGGLGFLDANLNSPTPPTGIAYTRKSFSEITPIMQGSLVLVVNKDLPVNNYNEFKEYVRKNPNKFNVGTWNSQLTTVLKKWAELEKLPALTVVPYKGSAPMMTDLQGGSLQFSFDSWAISSTNLEADRVKVIAVVNEADAGFIKRTWPANKSQSHLVSLSTFQPKIGFFNYNALYGPGPMPAHIVNEINRVVNKAIKDPEYAPVFAGMRVEATGGTPKDLERIHTRLFEIFENANKK